MKRRSISITYSKLFCIKILCLFLTCHKIRKQNTECRHWNMCEPSVRACAHTHTKHIHRLNTGHSLKHIAFSCSCFSWHVSEPSSHQPVEWFYFQTQWSEMRILSILPISLRLCNVLESLASVVVLFALCFQ